MKATNDTNNSAHGDELNCILARAKEGSIEALEALKRRYAPLIESQISKHSVSDMSSQDVSDLREEAGVIFCNAVSSYDYSEGGVEFGLYAKICIENGLVSFIRSYFRRKKNSVLPLDNVSLVGKNTDFLQRIVDEENTAELIKTIKQELSSFENRVWWMYVSGMSVSDIAASLEGVDAKSVSNAVYRIRRKLKAILLDRDKT